MNEKELTNLGSQLTQKQIELAKIKGNKGEISEIVKRETELVALKREFNLELDKLAKVGKGTIVDTE
ncbi:MAG: hypothetical protein NWF07_05920 [Candidatus Bathyarchaeota archaeon]|nr:hypothetical protein [Candidatus Bathyarchaeota archaeon]